jgi:hypothetical protein
MHFATLLISTFVVKLIIVDGGGINSYVHPTSGILGATIVGSWIAFSLLLSWGGHAKVLRPNAIVYGRWTHQAEYRDGQSFIQLTTYSPC